MKNLLIGLLALGSISAYSQDKTINISAKHLYKPELIKITKLLEAKGYKITNDSQADFTIEADCSVRNGGALALFGIAVERPTPGQLQCTGECIVRADVAFKENLPSGEYVLEIVKSLKDWKKDQKSDCSKATLKAIKKLNL